MTSSVFIGRKSELERLEALYKKKTPSLVVVKGLRRIGKSRLIGEFGNISSAQTFWVLQGLRQRMAFLRKSKETILPAN